MGESMIKDTATLAPDWYKGLHNPWYRMLVIESHPTEKMVGKGNQLYVRRAPKHTDIAEVFSGSEYRRPILMSEEDVKKYLKLIEECNEKKNAFLDKNYALAVKRLGRPVEFVHK